MSTEESDQQGKNIALNAETLFKSKELKENMH